MCRLVQVLQQSEVCGEEDVCSALGHQIAGMVGGVTIHLSGKPDCWILPRAASCESRCQQCHLAGSTDPAQWR